MKFATEDIVEALKETQINPDDIDAVLHKLEEIADEIKKEKDSNRTPRQKKKLVLLNPKDTASYYVIQAVQDDDCSNVESNLKKAIGDYNQRAKRKKVEITNNTEAIEFIPNKILKDNGIVVKAKEPCQIVNI